MKNTLRNVTSALMGSATVAYAADGAQPGGMSMVLIFFLAFFALVVVFQTVPGLLLFFSMLKGLFSPSARKDAAADSEEVKKSL